MELGTVVAGGVRGDCRRGGSGMGERGSGVMDGIQPASIWREDWLMAGIVCDLIATPQDTMRSTRHYSIVPRQPPPDGEIAFFREHFRHSTITLHRT